jgi:hypothetical protein
MRRKLSIYLLISVTVFYSCKAQAEQKKQEIDLNAWPIL